MAEEYIDLSFTLEGGMLTYPSRCHPPLEITQLGSVERDGRDTRKIIIGSHTGTHMDAALHFIKDGQTIEQLPLDILVGKATVIDFSDEKYQTKITKDVLEEAFSNKPINERVLFRFDWSSKFGNSSYYEDYPHFSLEACQWMLSNGIKLIGLDTPSPDDPADNPASGNDSPNHKLLLGNNIILVEYLCNLNKLNDEVFLMALPLKIKGADGAPSRVVVKNL